MCAHSSHSTAHRARRTFSDTPRVGCGLAMAGGVGSVGTITHGHGSSCRVREDDGANKLRLVVACPANEIPVSAVHTDPSAMGVVVRTLIEGLHDSATSPSWHPTLSSSHAFPRALLQLECWHGRYRLSLRAWTIIDPAPSTLHEKQISSCAARPMAPTPSSPVQGVEASHASRPKTALPARELHQAGDVGKHRGYLSGWVLRDHASVPWLAERCRRRALSCTRQRQVLLASHHACNQPW